MKTFLMAVLLLGCLMTAAGQTSADAFRNLEAAMKKEVDSKPKPSPGQERREEGSGMARFMAMAPAQIEAAMASGETYRVDEVLNQLPTYFTSEEVRQQIATLRAVVKKEREAKQNVQLAAVKTALKQASDAIRTAKNPEDLDDVLKSLSRYRNQSGSDRFSEEGRAALHKIGPTIQFVQQWQDYLAARKSGNNDRCREALRNLANSSEMFDLMPRSQLLAELEKYPYPGQQRQEPAKSPEPKADPPKPEELAAIVAKAKTLDGLPGVIDELRQIQARTRPSNNSSTEPFNATLNFLIALEKTHRDFQAGLATKIEGPSVYSPDNTSTAVVPLKGQLLLLLLPRYLYAPADLMPKPSEPAVAYLQRVADEARKRGDGALMVRARDALRTLNGNSTFGPDYSAIAAFAAGQNQEAAGQFALAVLSYEQALKTGIDGVPAKLIGDRLALIKTEHPAEFEEGIKQFLNPPRSDRPPYWVPPDYPQPSSLIPVPAATATATGSTPTLTSTVSPTPAPKVSPTPSPRTRD